MTHGHRGTSLVEGTRVKLNPYHSVSPLSEAVQVVVETGSLLATLFSPQDAGGVDDAAVQHGARHERCTQIDDVEM